GLARAGSLWWVERAEGRRLSTTTGEIAVDQEALEQLAGRFRGELITPRDRAFDDQRKIWNGSIDRRPALIARCAGVADVIAAVQFARKQGLLVALRSGGHSYPGLSVCDAGIVIDLGQMKGIRVDPEARTVRAQAGVLLGEMDRETQAFGHAVPAGIVTHTGLAGLTLGGGVGWLQRKHGLTIDQLLSVDVVTAEGELVRASEEENADLFWGLRGGGGNFGIVTEFEFRLNPVGPMVLAGPVIWPMEDSPQVLRFYREWIQEVPEELTTIVTFRRVLPVPSVPEELHGRHVVIVGCCYAGPVEEGERVLKPLWDFGSLLVDGCAPMPYVAHQAMLDPGFPHGWWYYIRSCNLAGLNDEVVDTMADHGLRIASPVTAFSIFHLGGAVARVGEDEAAFTGRDAGHVLNIIGITRTGDGFDPEREWARGLWSALEPHHQNVYVNFLMEEGDERIRQAYGATKYDRLKALKRKYDPDNFF
ncbi:MAG: FAD-binding oxidoreductase, partial [Actinomycetota bacterium]